MALTSTQLYPRVDRNVLNHTDWWVHSDFGVRLSLLASLSVGVISDHVHGSLAAMVALVRLAGTAKLPSSE